MGRAGEWAKQERKKRGVRKKEKNDGPGQLGEKQKRGIREFSLFFNTNII
jgi:hypothetical protein